MTDDRRNYVLVGAFVLAMTIALLVWLALLAGKAGPSDHYSIVYRNVLGLEPGVEILYEGHPIGFIDAIEPLDRDGVRMYRVDIGVERGWPIPKDSVAAITAPGLLSAVVVDIRGGASRELLSPGAEIPGREASDVLTAVNAVADQTAELLEQEVRPMLAGVSEQTPKLLEDMGRFTEALNRTAEQLNTLLGEQNQARVAGILGNAEDASERLASLLEGLGATRRQLDDVVARLDVLLDEGRGSLGSSARELDHTLAAVARHIDAITANLEATSRNLSEASQQVRDDPSILVRGRESDEAAP